MKIIIPIPGGFGNQGGWRVLSELANNWIKQEHEVYFLVHKTSNDPYFPTTAKILWYGNTGKLSEGNSMDYEKPILKYLGIAYAMRKALSVLQCDVVLATLSLSALPIYLTKINATKAYYIQAHEPSFYYGYSPKQILYRNLSRLSYKLGLASIVNSPFYFRFKGIRADKYVYPGIDFNLFYPKEECKISSSRKIILGTIGRMEIHKGTQHVLDAFRKIRFENRNVELHIAFGDKSLESIEGVKVLQFKGDSLLSDYYNTLDIYICGGTMDLGAVHYPVIEAMACGVPVVTTGYLPANNDNAWIVPTEDSLAIVNQINQIIADPALTRLKVTRALEDVKVFDWDKVSRKMINIFENL